MSETTGIRQIEAGIDAIDRNQLLNSSIEDFIGYFAELVQIELSKTCTAMKPPSMSERAVSRSVTATKTG